MTSQIVMPMPWPTNSATPPQGWHVLIDTDGTRPMGWFTTAHNGMRTVARGYPTWEDAPFDIPADCRTTPTPEELDYDEMDIFLHTLFNLAYRGYVFPDVDTAAGPPTHSFTNLDFVGGWTAAIGHGAVATEALLARTIAGQKPASETYFYGDHAATDRDRWASAARDAGLAAIPYRIGMGRFLTERLWVAPSRLAERVDRAVLSAAWKALLDADPDSDRREWLASSIQSGLDMAFEVDLLQPITEQREQGLPHAWWDDTTDEGLVMLGAVLGYPPASTYAILAELDGPVAPAVAT